MPSGLPKPLVGKLNRKFEFDKVRAIHHSMQAIKESWAFTKQVACDLMI
jgi:hypothetical protein